MKFQNLALKSVLAVAAAMTTLAAAPAYAAGSQECQGGGFQIVGLVAGRTVRPGTNVIPAAQLNPTFRVVGRYVEFTVVTATLGIRDYTFTGAANPADMTGGRRIVVWSEKTPDHLGRVLGGAAEIELKDTEVSIQRSNGGGFLDVKIQAKDCAAGGIFQMEVERDDDTATRFTHVLAPGVFYYDNPNFRAREGDVVPFRDTTLTVGARINIGAVGVRNLVARDSAQVAERVEDADCVNEIPTRDGGVEEVLHCGRFSRWDVASGGRMGFVTGEDAVEVAPPASDCVRRCQAQNRVRGAAVVLGFPFPTPVENLLEPDFPAVALAQR